MSSSEAEGGDKARAAKRQRVPRAGLACDRCRKRKMKCNGRLGGEKCRYCAQNGWACEYLHAMQKYQIGYVQSLERQIERLFGVLKRLYPEEDFASEVGAPVTEVNWSQQALSADAPAIHTPSVFAAWSSGSSPNSDTYMMPKPGHNPGEPTKDELDEDDQATKLAELTNEFDKLAVGAYHGPHSSAGLVSSALELTFELTGVRLSQDDLARCGRPMYWRFNPWERPTSELCALDFPPPDLLEALVELYFTRQNPYMPVLHRPTFTRLVGQGLHRIDGSFGFVVLLACANGARYSDDPRVLLPGSGSQSAGWKWFDQMRGRSAIHNGTSRLWDMQAICLATMYLMGCAATNSAWTWNGHGIRLGLDVGAHKRRTYLAHPTPEDEQFKRTFWILTILDKQLSITMGRPAAISDELIDIDYPLPVDDGFWEHSNPAQMFKQPENQPSRLDLLTQTIKLYETVGPSMCLIFSGGKLRRYVGAADGKWERPAMADIESRMHVWAESVPPHIRWEPENLHDDVLFLQAAHLWARYYDLQLALHRPFIAPRPSTPVEVIAELGFPSLSICMSAARAIVRIIARVQQRFPGQLFPLLHKPVNAAGMMLFLGIWGSYKFGVASRVAEDVQGIHICQSFLETLETRIHPAGRSRDIMNSLLHLVKLPPSAVARGQKRTLEEAEFFEPPPEAAQQSAPACPEALASLDDWFAGSLFDLEQPLPQTTGSATGAGVNSQWDAAFLGTEFGPSGASDPLLAMFNSVPSVLPGDGAFGSVGECDVLAQALGAGSAHPLDLASGTAGAFTFPADPWWSFSSPPKAGK